jgi:hypothetical protein
MVPVLAVFLVLVLAGAVFGLALVRGGDEPVAAPTVDPEPTATEEPTEPPTAEATEEATEQPGEAAEGFDEIAEQISEVRGLPVQGPVNARIVSEQALADKVIELAFEDLQVDEVEADRRLLVALRLLDDDVDLLGAIEALYREQILGVYVPEEATMYVRTGSSDLSPYERLTAAHEVTHALQDQSYDLGSLQEMPEEESDAQLAFLAVVEGDAVLTQEVWSANFQSEEDRRRVRAEAFSGGGAETLANTPRYLRESLAFPYREGVRFAQTLFEQGGFDAINEALADPPTTTAEILHPERYFAGKGAVEVGVGGNPGPGWDSNATYSFGEFDLRQLLLPLGEQTVEQAATGWAGGEVQSWARDDDIAVGLALTFDSTADADEACAALRVWYAEVAGGSEEGPGLMRGTGDWMAMRCSGADVRVGLGPDGDVARRAVGG